MTSQWPLVRWQPLGTVGRCQWKLPLLRAGVAIGVEKAEIKLVGPSWRALPARQTPRACSTPRAIRRLRNSHPFPRHGRQLAKLLSTCAYIVWKTP